MIIYCTNGEIKNLELNDIEKYEIKVVDSVNEELMKATSIDTVNKIYRQARNWSRYHYHFGCACSKNRWMNLNHTFFCMRKKRLAEIKRGI